LSAIVVGGLLVSTSATSLVEEHPIKIIDSASKENFFILLY
jgi:hypothetical protein